MPTKLEKLRSDLSNAFDAEDAINLGNETFKAAIAAVAAGQIDNEQLRLILHDIDEQIAKRGPTRRGWLKDSETLQ